MTWRRSNDGNDPLDPLPQPDTKMVLLWCMYTPTHDPAAASDKLGYVASTPDGIPKPFRFSPAGE
jgi:hypothetical protein